MTTNTILAIQYTYIGFILLPITVHGTAALKRLAIQILVRICASIHVRVCNH